MDEILTRRNIDYLVHFTRVENLESIFDNGLMPREDIDEDDNVDSVFNDHFRYDKCESANCLSVEFPNYKMFYTLCCDNPGIDWAVLVLDAELINEFECAFCYANAGSREIYTIPLKDRQGADALEEIFAERDGYPRRQVLEIPDWYPTNPQAEVLVFGTIPVSYIKGVIFKNEYKLNKYMDLIPENIECIDDEKYFYGRSDNKHWRKLDG